MRWITGTKSRKYTSSLNICLQGYLCVRNHTPILVNNLYPNINQIMPVCKYVRTIRNQPDS